MLTGGVPAASIISVPTQIRPRARGAAGSRRTAEITLSQDGRPAIAGSGGAAPGVPGRAAAAVLAGRKPSNAGLRRMDCLLQLSRMRASRYGVTLTIVSAGPVEKVSR